MSKTNTESSPERNIINSAKIFKPSYTQIVTKHQPASTQFTELSHDLHSQSTGRDQQAKKSTSTSTKSVDAVLASNFENQFKTAVLSAVHSEMKSIARRSTSIVVSGFHKRSTVSDKDHFIKFCSQFYEFEPKIVSTRRLGRDENNKVQPLLITFADTSEPEYLVNNARWLRSVSDEYVRNNIFINKHLTYAERKAAFEERLLRRKSSASGPSGSSQRPKPSSSNENSSSVTMSASLSTSAESFVPVIAGGNTSAVQRSPKPASIGVAGSDGSPPNNSNDKGSNAANTSGSDGMDHSPSQ